MTIERGRNWGGPASPGSVDEVASSNEELRRLVEDQWQVRGHSPRIGLTGGDLWKALGEPSGGIERINSSKARQVPVDVIECRLDGRPCLAVAHVFLFNNWWRGPVVAIMNSEWRGVLRVAPKAHPNDGMLDLVEGDLPIRQRILIRRRLLTGDHLPNSALKVNRIKEFTREFRRPVRVVIDGAEQERCRQVSLRVQPDALTTVY